MPRHIGWLSEDKSTKTTPPTGDKAKGQFVPRADQVCSCGGMRTRFEKSCRECRTRLGLDAQCFAYQGKALLAQADAWLKAGGAKVNRRGELWEKTAPEAWEAEAPVRDFPMPVGFPKARGKLKGEV